jgi:hypothetical protein
MFLADWLGVGNGSHSGDFKVSSLYNAAKYPNVSPYAAYVGGKLDRVAVIDLNEWNSTEKTSRVERTFQVGVGGDVKTAELRRLTGNGTNTMADNGGITYAGEQWTAAMPAGKRVGDETEKVNVADGKLSFQLKASEAVLITVHR